jgi:hypothetical protein
MVAAGSSNTLVTTYQTNSITGQKTPTFTVDVLPLFVRVHRLFLLIEVNTFIYSSHGLLNDAASRTDYIHVLYTIYHRTLGIISE